MRYPNRGALRAFLLFSLALLMSPAVLLSQDRDPQLEALADQLAHKLSKSKPVKARHVASVSYLVFDFGDSSGKVLPLGTHLADALADALRSRLPELSSIERSQLHELCNRDRIDPSALQDPAPAWWAARMLGANLAILGTIDSQGAQFVVRLRAIDKSLVTVAEASGALDSTDTTREWDKPLSSKAISRATRPGIYHPGSNGVTAPVCLQCPNPGFTEEARLARFSGVVMVDIVIGPDGSVQEASPIRGLPYGLTAQAIAMIRTWQFRPAIGPGGNPVAVVVDVEVSFRIK